MGYFFALTVILTLPGFLREPGPEPGGDWLRSLSFGGITSGDLFEEIFESTVAN